MRVATTLVMITRSKNNSNPVQVTRKPRARSGARLLCWIDGKEGRKEGRKEHAILYVEEKSAFLDALSIFRAFCYMKDLWGTSISAGIHMVQNRRFYHIITDVRARY